MRLTIRRIGNSLGVIIPKSTLDAWGLSEGDTLELTARLLTIAGTALPALPLLTTLTLLTALTLAVRLILIL